RVWQGTYSDPGTLRRVPRDLESLPGVSRAAAMMGTPGNRALMQDAGLLTAVGQSAGATDLVIGVIATDEATARRAESAVRAALTARAAGGGGAGGGPRPRTRAPTARAAPG